MVTFRGFSYYQHRDDAAEASLSLNHNGIDINLRVPLPEEMVKYIKNFTEQAANQALLDGGVYQPLGNERRH